MIASSYYNMLAVLILVLIGVTYSAVIPAKERSTNEEWAEDYNLVEPPPAVMFFSHVFDHSKSKISPQDRLKSVIKAIYHFDSVNNARTSNNENKDLEILETVTDLNVEDKNLPVFPIQENEKELDVENKEQEMKSEEFYKMQSNEKEEKLVNVESQEQTQSSLDEQSILQGTTQIIDVEPTEQTEHTTQKLEVLLEDLVDSIIHVPAHMEGDKAQKFTHSIRYGYGVPFHYNGL